MAGRIITSEELASSSSLPDFVRSGAFSPAVKAGPFVYISGTLAKDTSKDMRGQADEVFGYIAKVLDEAGYSMIDVVKIQAFITNKDDYPGYSEMRRKYFPTDPPASTTVVADLLTNIAPGALVEIEAVAYKE